MEDNDHHSSTEEGEETSGAYSDTDSGEEKQQPLKSTQALDPSGSETESPSGSDSDSPSKMVDSNVKKVGSKTTSPAKSKRPPAAPATIKRGAKKAKQKSANKRQAPTSDAEDSDADSDLPPNSSVPKSLKNSGSKATPPSSAKRKASAPLENENDNSKKQLIQRKFSFDDDIAILQGIIDYEKNWESLILDIGDFHDFIKESLDTAVSNTQLASKVKRLKRKYEKNAKRENDGKAPSFTKNHERKSYQLSKLIWGCKSGTAIFSKMMEVGNAGSLLTSNGVDGKQKSKTKKNDVSSFPLYGESPKEIVRAGMELVDASKRAELEVKWKELKRQELLNYVKRMELQKEEALLVLEKWG